MSHDSQDRPGHTKAENNPIISVVLNNRCSFLTHNTCPLWVNREVHLILVTQGLKLINTANRQARGKQSSEGSCTSSYMLSLEMTRTFAVGSLARASHMAPPTHKGARSISPIMYFGGREPEIFQKHY